MENNEKKIKEKAEAIMMAFVEMSMGKEIGLLSSPVYKNLRNNENFAAIRALIIEHLQKFDGEIDSSDEWLELTEFRLRLLHLYDETEMTPLS